MIAEPDVTLTDFALALECGAFAALVGSSGPLGRWFLLLFVASAVGALAGGVVHGFFSDAATRAGRFLWRLALLAVGVAALAACGAAACLLGSPGAGRWIVGAATLGLGLYAALGVETFAVAVASYLAASACLLAALARVYARTGDDSALTAAAGLALTFAGAGLQRARVAFPAARLGHNAVFHVVQGVALALVFHGVRGLARRYGC